MDQRCPLSGRPLAALPGPTVRVEVIAPTEPLPDIWLKAIPVDHPLLRPEWMHAARRSLPDGSQSCCTLALDGDRLLAAAFFEAVPLRTGTLGTIEKGGAWQTRAGLRLLASSPCGEPHVLVCGDIIRTDTPGAWFSPQSTGQAGLFHAMAEAARAHLNVSTVMVICSARSLGASADALPALGYHRIDKAEPPMEVVIDPTWSSFDDYLAALRPKYRQRARSARKRAATVERTRILAEQVVGYVDEFDRLLQPILERAQVTLSMPSGQTVAALVESLGEPCRVHAYHHEDQLVAFTVSLHTADSVEGLLVGFDPSLNRRLKLYQNILYDFIEASIDAGVSTTSLGRTALEIKSAVGATPNELPVYIRHPSFLMHSVLGWAAGALSTPDWTPRSPFRADAARRIAAR